jgi:hypothetical protein
MTDEAKIVTNIFNDVKRRCRDFMQHPGEAIPFMQWAIDELRKVNTDYIRFVEIGVAEAGNFTFIGNVLQYFFPYVHGIGIDKFDRLSNMRRMKPKCHWEFVLGHSGHAETVKTAKWLGTDSANLLYIDGGHRDTECADDIGNYCVPPVIVGIHDYTVLRHEREYPSILELEERYTHREWIVNKNVMGVGAFVVSD